MNHPSETERFEVGNGEWEMLASPGSESLLSWLERASPSWGDRKGHDDARSVATLPTQQA
jgi:hypothetical protein